MSPGSFDVLASLRTLARTGRLGNAGWAAMMPGRMDLAAPHGPDGETIRLTAPNYATVTWDQLHRDARTLAAALMPLGPWRGIVAVSRGGLIPAAIIARELECRLVESVSVAAYHDEARGDPVVLKPPAAAADGEGFLIVDDLVDSGVTAKVVRALLPRAHFACLYAKPAGRSLADSWVAEVPQDTWILFPWDTAPLFVPPMARGPAPAS